MAIGECSMARWLCHCAMTAVILNSTGWGHSGCRGVGYCGVLGTSAAARAYSSDLFQLCWEQCQGVDGRRQSFSFFVHVHSSSNCMLVAGWQLQM
jgi:hypothetical protein